MWKLTRDNLPGLYWLFLVLALYTFVFVKDSEIQAPKDTVALVFLGVAVLLYLHRRLHRWNSRRKVKSIDHHLRRALDHDAPHPPKGI